ncbi:MAG TPA: hypothetical protein VK871_15135 [Candidatus Limnocylindrales bacterium]|nr:hypothetical protein [Candidatus Limnocylindrales bacterium]
MSRVTRTLATAVAALAVIAGLAGPAASGAAAADGPAMEARVLLEGHARIGSWLAVEVRLRNEGVPVVGELRLQGGTQGGTRFSMPVDLPSPSDKVFTLHAQPPSFGQQLEVLLAVGDAVVARQKVAFAVHDATALTVGVVADQPQGIVGGLELPAGQNNAAAPVVIPLDPADLPERIEAWSALDRLVWQDVDTNTLTSRQIEALRGWLALGGRLVIVGGTAGPGVLSGFPDAILPYRPATTLDIAPESLAGLLGRLPSNAADVPALTGELINGRALASSGDAVVAAELAYGSGSVTLLGVDPTVGWIAESRAAATFWRTSIPPQSGGSFAARDDSQIVGAVSELPVLALPPTSGLLLLLLGYIALIGPVNYFVLRRLDRREWAWITMPVLIAVFAAGAYAFGSALRGSDVIVNEIAVVRGAPDTTEGSAQVYLGVFSPTRGTYQVAVPGGALLSSPVAGDIFGGTGAQLDVIQGDPARVRDLSVGFGSLRTMRAETPVVVPRIHAELELVDGVLKGTIRNDSEELLEAPAVVLGGSTALLPDLQPGASAPVNLRIVATGFGQSLSDKLFGQVYYENGPSGENQRRSAIRHRVIDQLTYDPMFGNLGQLPSDGPVVLAWGRDALLPVEVQGQKPARSANVLYYVPVGLSVRGTTTFRSDLIRSTVVETDAAFFSKEPFSMSFGQGSVTIDYRPIPFEGTFAVRKVLLALGFGGEIMAGGGKPIRPLPEPSAEPVATDGPNGGEIGWDGMPEVEVFDRTAETWLVLPHLAQGTTYELSDPADYVDPATGSIDIRFVNDRQDTVGFSFSIALEGIVR